jgi:hypothetical protein
MGEASSSTRESSRSAMFDGADGLGVPVLTDAVGLLARPDREGTSRVAHRARSVTSRAHLGALATTFVASDPSDGGITQNWADDFDSWFTPRRQELLEGAFA